MGEDSSLVADVLALVAIVVSVLSALYTSTIEGRVRKQSDARSAFDATIHAPIEAQLQILTGILQSLSDAGMINILADRSAALSDLQRGKHQTWYFSMVTCLESIERSKGDQIEEWLNSYWDTMADAINELNIVVDPKSHLLAVRKVVSIGQGFLASARNGLQAARSKL